jgi:nicotinamidase-related amidase
MILVLNQNLLLIVDPQSRMMPVIQDSDTVIARMQFLTECARLLSIPVWSTRQNPEKLGDLEPGLEGDRNFDKMAFSAFPVIADAIAENTNVIVAGVETHICVYQTVRDLLGEGFSVQVAADAVGARTPNRHGMGMQALTSVATPLLHSEALVYDWLRSADHPRFRDVLGIVKRY